MKQNLTAQFPYVSLCFICYNSYMSDTDNSHIITPPTEQDVRDIVRISMGKDVAKVYRYPTVISNFVYDVQTKDGEELIVKLARPDVKHFFDGALFWYKRLEEIEIPIPKLYYSDINGQHGFPILIMEKLPGEDLESAYPSLSFEEKKAIAKKVVTFQQKIATLPKGKGYGNARSYDDSSLFENWIDFLNANVESSREKIKEVGLIDEQVIDTTKEKILQHENYFSTIKPTCYLANMTTKNVVINNGKLSGITGIHNVAFGDPIYPIALTKMTLLSYGYDTDYIDYWLKELQMNEEQKKAFDSYTLMFCVERMAELGHSVNKKTTEQVDEKTVNHLQTLFNTLITNKV